MEESRQQWFVYVLYSVSTGRLYTGVSTDPYTRLVKHNNGTGAKNTRYGRPWTIVYIEKKKGRGDAQQREAAIKKMKREAKILLVGLAA